MDARPGLADLVNARAVAIVGASQDPGRIGGRPIRFLRECGFPGRVYPVNARRAEVQGLRAYPDLTAIPEPVDAAIVAVPADDVTGVIEACGRKGVKVAIVFSSGFGEVGAAGRALQAELGETARRANVRVVGPNCQGVVAVRQALNLSFSSAFVEWGPPGDVGLVVQSGAIGGMLAALLRERGVGFSYWISSGNEADVDLPECIEFLTDDADTRVIAAYVENMRGGRRLLAAVSRARAAGKAVVLLRSGRSAQSARAAVSHTGAVAAENRVAVALLEQTGATEARDVQTLLDDVYAFARVRGTVGKRIGIVSNSGGLGVIMSDTAADLGLDVPRLPDALQRELAGFLPAFGATGNPVDMTAQVVSDQTLLPRALDVMLRAPDVNVVVVALAMVNRMYPVDTIVRDIVFATTSTEKPLAVAWVASAPEGGAALEAAGVPLFTDGTRCLRALGAVARSVAPPVARVALDEHPRDAGAAAVAALLDGVPAGALDEAASHRVLAAYGVPVAAARLVATPDDAVAAADALGYPVAVKACAAGLAHKSEDRLVALGLSDAAGVRAAAADVAARFLPRVPAASARGLLVQRMAPAGVEIVLGARRDPLFGPVVMVGLGGVFVEHLDDVAFGLAPLAPETALALLRSLRAWPLLAGARGRRPVDAESLARALAAVSRLAFDFRDRIREIDVNPVLAVPGGPIVAVDALVVLDGPESGGGCRGGAALAPPDVEQ